MENIICVPYWVKSLSPKWFVNTLSYPMKKLKTSLIWCCNLFLCICHIHFSFLSLYHTLKYGCGFLLSICYLSVQASTYDNTIFSNIFIRKSPYYTYKKQIKNNDFFFDFFQINSPDFYVSMLYSLLFYYDLIVCLSAYK